ncbi:hypothetical protein [Streptomyces sp. SID161]|nr:hypothetical protein [Streptomyces sp. SID161]
MVRDLIGVHEQGQVVIDPAPFVEQWTRTTKGAGKGQRLVRD